MGESCGTYSYGDEEWCVEGFVGEALGKGHFIDVGVDGVIILKWIFKKWFGMAWTVLLGSVQEQASGRSEGGNKTAGS
jgi:hypothetical protein